ncbi:MAG: glycerol-3-phosphate 1-O-acyltransferase PlsY [Clostridia bacterium]|nr:glycerol-3-phosphate 1-O-acyltransferase PlsY [Clostridia bacterium]
MTWLYVSLSIIIGYLFGSISVSVILSKVAFKGDVRKFGSGNAGATNMARVYGLKGGLIVLIGDFLKAILSCTIALLIAPSEYTEICIATVGVACMVGHAFPVFFGFKGGKGVSVGAAVALMVDWKVLVFIVAVFIITFIFTRIVSISSIMGSLGIIFITLLFYVLNLCGVGGGYFDNFTIERLFLAFVGGVFVIWLHRANLMRLLNGEEKKFTFKKKEKKENPSAK